MFMFGKKTVVRRRLWLKPLRICRVLKVSWVC